MLKKFLRWIHKIFIVVISESENWEEGCRELLFSTLDPFMLFGWFSNSMYHFDNNLIF